MLIGDNIVMKYILVGGKTGGHIYPGIALAQEIKEKQGEVFFFSPCTKIDKIILGHYSFPYVHIISRSPGKVTSLKFISFLFCALLGTLQSLYYLIKLKPDVIIGLGGFPSVPGIIASRILGKKVVLLEQNVKMGKANKFLLPLVQKLCLSFKETMPLNIKYFNKAIVTGNPIRKDIINCLTKSKKEILDKYGINTNKQIVLALGGSQGARIINNIIKEFLDKNKDSYYIVHITGDNNFESGADLIMSFCEQIGELFAISDLVISRAGGTTLAELDFLQKKCVLIPFARAAEAHQQDNAMSLVNKGLAEIIEEKHLTVQSLEQAIFRMINSKYVNENKVQNPNERIMQVVGG